MNAGTLVPIQNAMPSNQGIITLAFATGDCTAERWGSLSVSSVRTSCQNLHKAGKKYTISTGGALGKFTCNTAEGFASFFDRYYTTSMVGIDFDIELGQTQAEINALVQRAREITALYPSLRISFTIATFGAAGRDNLPAGKLGIMTVTSIKNAFTIGGVLRIPTTWYINLMTMYFGGCLRWVWGACSLGLGGG